MQPAISRIQKSSKHNWMVKQVTFGESLVVAVEPQSGHHIPPSVVEPTMAPPTVNVGAPLGEDEPMGICQECHMFPKKTPVRQWCAEECSEDGNFWRWANQWFPKDQLVQRVQHSCCFQCVVSTLYPERTYKEGRRHGRKCAKHHGSHHPASVAQSFAGAFVSGRTANFPVQSRLVGISTGVLQITTTTAEDVSMTELGKGITALAIDN